MATRYHDSALFPSLAHELGEHAALFEGEVLNAGSGGRDFRSLVPGRVHNQDIAEGLHNADVDIFSPLDEIPVEDGFFDAIFCNAVLEHVANPEEVMTEFARVCKPGGVLYLCVPFMQPEHLDPTDFQRYTVDGLKLLAERHGFDVQAADGVHNVYVTLGWIAMRWLEASDRLHFRIARRLVIPWLVRKAHSSSLHVHSLASSYRVIAKRRPEPALVAAEIADVQDAATTTCFLHVPKSGGVSIREALEAALPDGSLAPRGIDAGGFRIFSDFDDFDRADDWARSQMAIEDSEIEALAEHRAVTGHFTLATLQRIAPSASISTVLREPRARLISLYLFFRLPLVHQVWGPYEAAMLSDAAGPLEEFLAQPGIAAAIDNQVCRMVMHGDPRIPEQGFIADGDLEPLAAATLERLDTLGFVGILESGDEMWQGLSQMFGAALEPVRTNESSTPESVDGADPLPPLDATAALDALDRRTVADRIVYETIVARTCEGPEEARRRADSALGAQLARFDEVSAALAQDSSQARFAQAHEKEE